MTEAVQPAEVPGWRASRDMRAPLSWLSAMTPLPKDAGTVRDTLDDLGMVVEGIERVGSELDRVTVAEVIEVSPIPGAERVRRALVDVGRASPVQVVSAAANFRAGDLVPLAEIGAELKGGLLIGRRKMVGVSSEGMLCSGAELGLSDDGAGIMVLPPGLEPGRPLADALGLSKDVVFDLAIEVNRPDAMCVAGIARDLAARFGTPFSVPPPPLGDRVEGERGAGQVVPEVSSLAGVSVEDGELCPRLVAMVATGVRVGRSSSLVSRRLLLCGMRSINSVVDASNYVMLELGQPTHAYDLARLAGREITARSARRAERLVTLDGIERVLGVDRGGGELSECVIADGEGTVIGIAGIMGGQSTEISGSTTSVLVESAAFSPMTIARTARRLGLRSEASARFERGVDPDGLERAAGRVMELIAGPGDRGDGAAVVAAGALAAGPGPAARHAIRLRVGRVNAMLGTEIEGTRVAALLGAMGFAVDSERAGVLAVRVPGYRPDVEREIDLIEEVARQHGYSAIRREVPRPAQVGGLTGYQRERRRIAEIMQGCGASEAWTATLLGPGAHALCGLDSHGPDGGGAGIEVENPLNAEESVLRRSLMPGLLSAVSFNTRRRASAAELFEIGNVFGPPPPGRDLPVETEHCAVVLAGGDGAATAAVRIWRTMVEAMKLDEARLVQDGLVQAGLVRDDALASGGGPESEIAWGYAGLHPGRRARLVCGSEVVGVLGEVAPEACAAWGLPGRVGWLDVDMRLLHAASRRRAAVRAASRFSSSDIDLAFVLPELLSPSRAGEGAATVSPVDEVRRTILRAAGDLLESAELFDVYRGPGLGPGERSVAFRLRFASVERTLTDAEVGALRSACIAAVEKEHAARLR
ncbi:MAG: phenylalanine--tRNA ligase subunit beta [Acidimicrobiales bacterium]